MHCSDLISHAPQDGASVEDHNWTGKPVVPGIPGQRRPADRAGVPA